MIFTPEQRITAFRNGEFCLDTETEDAQGLIGWYALGVHGGKSKDWDYSPFNRHGTRVNGPTPKAVNHPRWGGIRALDFEDSSTQYVDLTSPLVIGIPLTLCIWANFESDPTHSVFGAVDGAARYLLFINETGIFHRPVSASITASHNGITLGEWNHWAFKKDSAGNSEFFQNGDGIGTASNSDSSTCSKIGSHGGTTFSFDGLLCDARIYNYAVPDALRKQIYNEPWRLVYPLGMRNISIPAAAGDTFTATAGITIGGVTCSASATFAPGTKTATAAPTIGGVIGAASATHVPPTFTATVSPTIGGVTASASASFASGVFTASAGLTIGGVSAVASGTFTPPVFTATVSPSIGGITAAASASFATITFTATAAPTIGPVSMAGSATFTPSATAQRIRNLRASFNHRPFENTGTSVYAALQSAGIVYRSLRVLSKPKKIARRGGRGRGRWIKGSGGRHDISALVTKTNRRGFAADPTASIDVDLSDLIPGVGTADISIDVRTCKDDVENLSTNARIVVAQIDTSGDEVNDILGTARLINTEIRAAGIVRIRFVWTASRDGVQPNMFRAARTAGPTSPADSTVSYADGRSSRIVELDTKTLQDAGDYTYKITAENGATTKDVITGITFTADAVGPSAPTLARTKAV